MIRTRTLAWLIGGILLLLPAFAQSQDWPQWRGPHRDNHVTGFTEPKSWPKELTKKWRVTVGDGESSPLLVGDKLYVFGRIDNEEVAMCLDAATGKEIWKDKHPTAKITNAASPHQGPRSTPAVAEGKMCTLGVRGAVSCLDATTGKLVWRKETKPVPTYYTSSSPLIEDGKCVVFVNALTAFDLANGNESWAWNGDAPYGSPNLMTVDGVKQVVSPYAGGLVGVTLADGKKLWQVDVPGAYQSNYSTPIVNGSMVYYSAAGGKKGGGNTFALKIEKKGDGFAATEVWKNALASHFYYAPVVKNDLFVGVTASGKNYFGVDAKSGKEVWKDTTSHGACGAIVDAGAVFLSTSSDKKLVAFKADIKGYKELATYTVSEGETWSVPIVAGNRIYVKDKVDKAGKGGTLTLWTIE